MDISDIYTILLRLAFYCDQNAAKKWISVLLKFYRSLIGNEPASDNTEVCEHRPSTNCHIKKSVCNHFLLVLGLSNQVLDKFGTQSVHFHLCDSGFESMS